MRNGMSQEEQQAFEKGVRDQMKHAGHPASQAEAEHHISELTDG